MVRCDVCGEDMKTAPTCALSELVVADVRRKRAPYGAETTRPESAEHCRDCGTSSGGFHHPGCSVEQCPVCMEQLFCCDCEKEEPEPLVRPPSSPAH